MRRAISILGLHWRAAVAERFPALSRSEVDGLVVNLIVPLAQQWMAKPPWTWRLLPPIVE